MTLSKAWGILFKKDKNTFNELWHYGEIQNLLEHIRLSFFGNKELVESSSIFNELISASFRIDEEDIDIFIICSSEGYYLFCSEPLVISQKLNDFNDFSELEEHLSGMLVAQGILTYSKSWSDQSSEKQRRIDYLYQDTLKQLNQSPTLVSNGSCNLSELNFSDLVKFHFLIRRKLPSILPMDIKNSWVYCGTKSGLITHFTYPENFKYEKINFLIILMNFLASIHEEYPLKIGFGREGIIMVNFYYGEKNVMLLNNSKALEYTTVIDNIEHLPEDIRADLTPSLSNYYYSTAAQLVKNDLQSIPYLKVAREIQHGSVSISKLMSQQFTTIAEEEKEILIDKILKGAETEVTEFLSRSSMGDTKVQLKLLILGDGAVGKTTSKYVFMGHPFRHEYKATLGVDFSSLDIAIERYTFQTQIWDLGGQPKFKQIRSTFYKGSSAAIVVFDLARRETLASVEKWVDELYSESAKRIPLVIFGNKKDLRNEGYPAISDEEAITFVKKLKERVDPRDEIKISYLPGSAKTGENLKLSYQLVVIRAAGDFFQDYIKRVAEVLKDT